MARSQAAETATRTPTGDALRPLAFVYDRPGPGATPETIRALSRLRVAACRMWAQDRGYDLAGDWVDDPADTGRPRFDALVAILRIRAANRRVLCLINDWDRLGDEVEREPLQARVKRAGGWTETASGDTDREKPSDVLLDQTLARFWGEGR